MNVVLVASIAVVAIIDQVNASKDLFTGRYSDPNHPNCLREIIVEHGTTNRAYVIGTDGNPGCPPDGTGDPWHLDGTIGDDGNSILVDFSPKGGPKDLKGVYEPSPTPGIRWPDGNLWARKSGRFGVVQ